MYIPYPVAPTLPATPAGSIPNATFDIRASPFNAGRMTTAQDKDAAAGIETTPEFTRFAQRNDIFTRAFWDPTVKTKQTDAFFASYRMEAAPRRGDHPRFCPAQCGVAGV